MGFFDWFKKKEHPGHILDDEDRRIGVETRQMRSLAKREKEKLELERERLNHEIEMMRMRAELEELQNDLYGEEDDEPESGDSNEALLATILAPMLARQQPAAAPQPAMPAVPSKRSYSDAEISTLLDAIPKNIRKVVKKLPDDALIARAKQYAPDADDDTIQRAISKIRHF